MKLYICENIKTAKWRKNILNDKKLSLAFAKKCVCDFINQKENAVEIVFAKNEYGKPYIESIYKIQTTNKTDGDRQSETEKIKIDVSIFFSLSHSENMTACAVACFNIGIDCQIKNIKNIEKCKKIAGRFYTEQENIYLNSILFSDDEQKNQNDKEYEYIHSFFKIWVKKEAYIKYTGKGLAEGLNTFSVTTKIKQKSYCRDVYFKRISVKDNFYIYLCYNKTNKNIWEIKYFN